MNSKLQFDNAISIMLAMPVTKLAKNKSVGVPVNVVHKGVNV